MPTFKKHERLKSRKLIDQLFQEGKSFGIYPLRLIWLETELPLAQISVQTSFAVPKRRFAKATARNRIKRKIREAFRLKKYHLDRALEDQERNFAFMILYTGKEDLAYDQIERAMIGLVKRFLKKEFRK
jgi:ribonuclease P protein component